MPPSTDLIMWCTTMYDTIILSGLYDGPIGQHIIVTIMGTMAITMVILTWSLASEDIILA